MLLFLLSCLRLDVNNLEITPGIENTITGQMTLASFSFFPNNTHPPLPGVNGSKGTTIRSRKTSSTST
jgi:hypothetical protein